MFSLLADPNGGRGRGALGLIVPLTLHDPGPEFGTGRGETDVVLGSEGGQFCEGCAVFFSVALPEQEAVRSRCLGFMRVSPVFLTAGAVEWNKSRSHCVWLLLCVRRLRNGTGAAAGKAGESRGVCELALWPARVISYAALAVTFWEQNS